MSIQQHARECAQLFLFPEPFRLDDKVSIAAFETQKSRFKIWAGNLGVFASERASADFRLRNDPNARGLLTTLLTQLANKLRLPPNGSQTRTGYPLPGSDPEIPDSDSDSSVASLVIDEEIDSEVESEEADNQTAKYHDVLRDIQEIISRLYRITSIVRRPGAGPKNERERVLRYVQNQDPPLDLSELKSHLEWQLSRLRDNHKHHGLVPGSTLHDRFVSAALYRRQRLLYCQSHQDKLQRGIDDIFATPQQQHVVSGEALGAIVTTTTADGETVANPITDARHGPAETLVGTEATAVDKVSPSTYAKSAVISGITASAAGRRGALDIPPAPRIADEDQTETQCPFCCHVIEDELKGRSSTREHQWRRHVMKDLDPYVCLFDDCSLAYPCFKTTEEWLHHMRWAHTTCYSCQIVGHEDIFFGTAMELEQHLMQEHREAIPHYELQDLVKQGCRPSPDVFAHLSSFLNREFEAESDVLLCPLCDFSLSAIEDGINVPASKLAVMRFPGDVHTEIRDHVASHMERLALLSLPEREDVEAESSAKRVSHLTLEEGDDEELTATPLSFDYSPESLSGPLENLAPVLKTWSEILTGWTFGHNCDYDPNDDPLINHFTQFKLTQEGLFQVYPAETHAGSFSVEWALLFLHDL
ncbi:hypothetical protein BJY01DRAFT_168120 [Aspergillus pseudoustus]|uniref:C2H2-type domain-containing protein n=1 Tax=Aspergillus pseudoustus TaxID=1810923 RepID=A0ABR4K6V4_9EURO